MIGDGVDLFGTFWFYWWIDHCVRTLSDPSFTDVMFHPLGKEIFAHTGNNFVDAILAWPVQAVLPYPFYQPIWVALILIGNGLSFRPLADDVVGKNTWASLAATLLWTINPFVLFECMAGRLTQALVWWVPLALLGFRKCGAFPAIPVWHWRRIRWPVLAGGMAALSGWTYWFLGYFLALTLAWTATADLLRPGARVRRTMVTDWLVAGVVCALLVLPGVLAMVGIREAGDVPGLTADVAQPWWELPRALGNNVSSNLHGIVLMERHGQPQLTTWTWASLAIVGLLGARHRLRWIGMAAIVAFFAIGPAWPGASGEPTRMFPYLLAYRWLPFFDRLWFPYRMVVMAFVGLSLAAAEAISRIEQSRFVRWAPVVSAVVLLGAAWEQHANLAFPLVHRDLTPPAVYETIGELGGGLIELPIGLARVSIAHQPVHKQPVFGGMAENAKIFWPPGYEARLKNPFIRFLKGVTHDVQGAPSFRPTDVMSLKADGFRWVVLDRHLVDANLHNTPMKRKLTAEQQENAPFIVQDAIIQELGPPVAIDGPLAVWDLRGWSTTGRETLPPNAEFSTFAPTAENLRKRSWPLDDMPAYERHLREQGRIPGGPPR